MTKPHLPVLLQEVIDGLSLDSGDIVVDATVGAGGHARALVEAVGKKGKLIGFDEDENALVLAEENLAKVGTPFVLVNKNFSYLRKELSKLEIKEVTACLFDLGISSMQLDKARRGFSFRFDEPLKMTLNANPGKKNLTASDLLNTLNEDNLEVIIRTYGEEKFAGRIARSIVASREENGLFEKTGQLVDAINKAVPAWYKHRRIHPATKTFQALRIAVNDELSSLKKGLNDAWLVVKPGGKIAVISFHSLESKIVKDFFREKVKEGTGELINKKMTKPSRAEVLSNPRSRSAGLRIIKKI